MEAEYPRLPLATQCIRIRLTNSVTGRSKNFRLSEKDLDDSVLEKVYESPAAAEVLKWPAEQSEQLESKSSQVQCVMKLSNGDDKMFYEHDMDKTSIQDIVDFQKEDGGSGDLIQLFLECVPVAESDMEHEDCHSPARTPPREAYDMTQLETRFSITVSPRISSPSILKSPASSKSASGRVSFRTSTIPAHLVTPDFDMDQKEAVSE